METDAQIRAEWIILADAAEVVNGKLYLLGGGWDHLVVNEGFPKQHHCGIAVSFRVPWSATNTRHQFGVEVTGAPGNSSVMQAGGNFEVSRPAAIQAGQTQRFQIAINSLLPFQRPGSYAIIVRIDGEEVGRSTFDVIKGQLPTTRAQLNA